MVFAVALIIGGQEHVKKFSKPLREIAWDSHHDKDGNPI
jgi:hypothetical protein